jgi:hypothetical protein
LANRISPHVRERVIAALKAHRNARAVARLTRVSYSTAWKIAKEEGIKLAVENPGLPPEKRAKIIAALEANPNASDVVKQVGGVSYPTIWKIANPRRRRPRPLRSWRLFRGRKRPVPLAGFV